MSYFRQFPIVSNHALIDQSFEPEGKRQQTTDAREPCPRQVLPCPRWHARAHRNR
jgi:hypothetical protein